MVLKLLSSAERPFWRPLRKPESVSRPSVTISVSCLMGHVVSAWWKSQPEAAPVPCLLASIPARDGMEVATHTPKLIESRRMQLKLLLRTHPLLCPSCDAAGDCRLQDLVHEYEVAELPFSRESRYFHVDNESHFIRFNMNLCIKCGMCVRICDEIQGENELSFIERGMRCEVSLISSAP